MASQPAESDDDEPAPMSDIVDDGPFAAWFDENWAALVSVGRLVARDPDDAEDLAMDTCEKLLVRWDRRRPDNPSAWAYRVMVNAHVRRSRLRVRVRAREELMARTEVTHEAFPDLDLQHLVRQLPQRQRIAVALRYAADLTQQDVADAMGVKPGTAAALLNQARTALRTHLGGES